MPSPPHTKISSALCCERLLDLLGREAALSAPRARRRRSGRARSSTRRSSGRPPPRVLPRWAITATRVIRAPLPAPESTHARSLARRLGSRTARWRSQRGPSARRRSTSSGWCMPRYMRESATTSGRAIASVQSSESRRGGSCTRRGDEQGEPDVDDDRGRHVPRGIALVRPAGDRGRGAARPGAGGARSGS